jgi:hypothetical protein
MRKTSPLLLLAMAALFAACNSGSNPSAQQGDAHPNHEGKREYAHLSIQKPGQAVWHLDSIELKESMSVRDLLVAADKQSSELQFRDTLYFGMGHLLTSLLGLANAKGEGAYWQFCIDNQTSNVGIDKMIVLTGQRVEWYYVTYGQIPCKKIGE